MLSNQLFVFPTSRSAWKYISQQKAKNQFLPKIITIEELFSKVILPPKGKTFVDDIFRILYLKQAVKSLDLTTLGLSKQFDKLHSQSDYLFKFFHELNSEFKTISDLDTYDTYGFYSEHLEALGLIYSSYISILEDNQLCDAITIPLNYRVNSDFIKEFDNIVIFYEGYFSSFEFTVIREIAKITQLGLHCTINKFNKKNIELFSAIDVVLDIGFDYFIDLSGHKIVFQKEQKVINNKYYLYEVTNRLAQIGIIKNSISEMIRSGIKPSSIVVVLPDMQFAEYLKEFNQEEYFNFSMGTDISKSSVLGISKAVNNYFNIDEPKYGARIEHLKLDKIYLDDIFLPYWKKKVQRNILFDLIKFVSKNEPNEQIKDYLVEVNLLIENLLSNVTISRDLTLKEAFKIFILKLNEFSLKDDHPGYVLVANMLETRHIQYDGVIVVDFNDSKVPKRNVKDKFISSKVKRYAKLPTSQDRENLQKYYYKKLFDNAKDIRISYVNNKDHIMSRFINELFEEPKILKYDFSQILHKFSDKEKSSTNIEQKINLAKLEWSATSLKTFLDCKRKYYLRYLLKIEEHDVSLKPKSYELGNIIHNILEKNYRAKKFEYKDALDSIVAYQNKNPYMTIELELWKKKLKYFFSNEKKRFDAGIYVYDLEKSFRIVQNGVTLKGKIDRIDKLQDETFAILDYKTSSSLKIDTEKNIDTTTDFQLEFYFLATKHLGVSQVGYYDLNDGKIKDEILLGEKLSKLDEILTSLETEYVEFSMCEKPQTCEFCPYKIICEKD